jgi:5-methyltetrahydrofolate--homocysteine methyltransferase
MELTSAYQLIPEQSTAAVIVHHPQAKYYAVRTAGEPLPFADSPTAPAA